jgi:hypothetical protein
MGVLPQDRFPQVSGKAGPEHNGVWYNPDHSGKGWFVVTNDTRLALSWYDYDNDGNLWWATGSANLNGNALEVPIIVTKSATFSDVSNVERIPAGHVLLEFSDENNGHIYWNTPENTLFGRGDMPIVRLL